MTDLPQHAAQISAWVHLDDPAYGFSEQYEIRLLTPYLAAYLPSRILAEHFDVLTSLKIVITFLALLHLAALYLLLRELEADRWWALLGLPLAFGYSYSWGFINYYAAIPLGIAYFVFVLRFERAPTLHRALLLTLLTTCLFFAHGLAFGICGLGAAGLLILSSSNLREGIRKCAPLLISLAIALAWLVIARNDSISEHYPYKGKHGWLRVVELLALPFGTQFDEYARALGAVLTLTFLLASRSRRMNLAHTAPLLVLTIAYLSIPQDAFNIALLYPRLAVFAFPFALLAFPPTTYRIRTGIVHGALVAACFTWACVTYLRAQSFDADARQFDTIMAQMEPNRRVRHLIFERGGIHVPGGVPFIHFPVWYQVKKGGEFAFTFAHTDVAVMRFREGRRNPVRAGAEWFPSHFKISSEHEMFDYYVVRAPEDYQSELFAGSPSAIELEAQSGMWWLYRKQRMGKE